MFAQQNNETSQHHIIGVFYSYPLLPKNDFFQKVGTERFLFTGEEIIPQNNSCELYFEERDIEAFIKNWKNYIHP